MRAFTAMRLRLELFVADMDASIAFYTRALGYRVVRRDDGYASLRRGAAVLGLGPVAKLPADGGGPGFTQERLAGRPRRGRGDRARGADLDAAYERPSPRGARSPSRRRRRPWGLRDFRLADPDGYYVRVTYALADTRSLRRSDSGVITLTGTPSVSTRRGRSRRSHFETRLGQRGDHDQVGPVLGDRGAHRLERVLRAREPFDGTAGRALQQRQRELQRPVRVLRLRRVRDQQRERARPLVGQRA